jgi:hypothetical protein
VVDFDNHFNDITRDWRNIQINDLLERCTWWWLVLAFAVGYCYWFNRKAWEYQKWSRKWDWCSNMSAWISVEIVQSEYRRPFFFPFFFFPFQLLLCDFHLSI